MTNIMQVRNSIPEFFSGKNVFITGGSGYMGKCLIEKLLRSCPDIGNIYMLMRSKRGVPIKERFDRYKRNVVFDTLRKENALATNKIIPICGDILKLGLDISKDDTEMLINNVTIVYHVAATVRFDEPLQTAILMNTRGTREVCKLVLEMKHILVFMHVSTVYCQLDKEVIEEKLYPPHGNWEEAIEIAETMSSNLLNVITPKFIGSFPNTYTFTKSLAEHVVIDMCNGKVPTIIYRPSIVGSAAHEPIPGYIGNFNGPMGIFTGMAKGILRIVLCDKDVIQSLIPIDTATKGMVIATWSKGQENISNSAISWYSASGKNILDLTYIELAKAGRKILGQFPIKYIWYPALYTTRTDNLFTKSFIIYYFYFMIYQMIPSIIADLLLKVLRKKPLNFQNMQYQIYMSNLALKCFTMNQWDIKNDNFLQLDKQLLSTDIKQFGYHLYDIEILGYLRASGEFIEPHMFKLDVIKQAKIQDEYNFKYWALNIGVTILFYAGICWSLYKLFFASWIQGLFIR